MSIETKTCEVKPFNNSKFLFHNLNQISYLFVICRLHEPLSKVALNRNMHHFLLLTSQILALNLLLNVRESRHTHVHHIYVGVLRTHLQRCVYTKLFGQSNSHKFYWLLHVDRLFSYVHQTWI